MSWLSKAFEQAAPFVAVLSPEPISRAAAQAKVTYDQIEAQRVQRQRIQDAEKQRIKNMELFNTQSSIPTIQANLAATTPRVSTSSSGGGFFDTLRGGLRDVGGFVSDVFSSGVPQLFGYQRPLGVAQQPALTTVTNIGAQESQGSGSIQAGAGTLLAPVIQGARNFLKTPQGQLALGGGAGIITSMLGGNGKTMRVTRKMKSQARMVLNMTGGNLSAAADILGIDQNTLVMILLKRFRNDGPVVTKAALRKTKQTVRRLKSMCDMYDSLRPTATRRRTPMKRSMSTTLIKN
jgi:hypothetical protein